MGGALDTGTYDVVVVGLGAAGSSAAAELARRGLRVLGVEQFTPAHDRGSSHGATRIIRRAYFERPDYVPLLNRAYELWDALCAETGQPLFVRCGALFVGTEASRLVTGSLRSAREHGLAHEWLDSSAIRSRFPQFAVPDESVAVYEPDAGYVLAEPSILAQLDRARAAGADLRFETLVREVQADPAGDGVLVDVGSEQLRAARVVIAAGAWAPRLIPQAGLPYEVTRQTVHWFAPDEVGALEDFAPERFPVYCADLGGGAEIYGFPHQQGDSGVKVGLYHELTPIPVDPDQLDRTITERDVDIISSYVARGLPLLAGRHLDGIVCLFAAVPDDDFVLGFHPALDERFILACGFSGHGFKFAPVVGEIVGDLVIDGATRHDIAFLSPGRLSAGA